MEEKKEPMSHIISYWKESSDQNKHAIFTHDLLRLSKLAEED